GDTIVTYTPDTQKATVKYVDQTGTQLITPDQAITGPSDTAVDHSQLMPNIQKAIDQGYVLVDDGTVGATFDHDTPHNQDLTITFGQVPKATLTTTVVPKGPKSPKNPDGEPLKPTTPVQVTGFPGDPIDAKDYPKVPGYTPEPNQNPKVPNEPGDTIVTYTPDTQKATVKYVDETGTQLVTPDQAITGPSDTAVDHSQLMPNIQKAIDQGYVLVDDGTVGATFDHDTPHNQEFTITFGQVPKATLTTTVVPKGPKSPTDPDGEPLPPTTPVQVIGFPGDPIDAKDYPKVPGYTPEPNQNLKVPNEPGDTIVTYTPDTQKATVKYVDETGKQLITPDQAITGPSDTAVDHSQLMPNIQKAIDQGYVLVDDGTVGATFDHDTPHNQEFTITFGQVPKATLTTTVVPKGPKSPTDPDGEPLPPTTPVQVIGFPGDPIDAKDYPKVPGYTPEPNQNLKVPNEPGDTIVTYTPD
ncbi:mucin-binding protein, partial [Lacticaseibacillus sp. GG6-2]